MSNVKIKEIPEDFIVHEISIPTSDGVYTHSRYRLAKKDIAHLKQSSACQVSSRSLLRR